MNKKVLIITYYWPPSGGSGVQRWLKFVKYLFRLGWEPYVYTPENPSFTIKDESLVKDVPEQVEVYKLPIWEPYKIFFWLQRLAGRKKIQQTDFISTEGKSFLQKISSWIRGNLFIPDARIFWVKPSVRFLLDFVQANQISRVITTGPPHSIHLIGLRLKQKLPELTWIADFRDPWSEWDLLDTLSLTSWAKARHKRLEKKVLTTATRVVTIAPFHVSRLEALSNRSVDLITNGFDEEDFESIQNSTTQKFTIRHIGVVDELRDPQPFMQALLNLIAKEPELESSIAIEFIGSVNSKFKTFISSNTTLSKVVTFRGQVPHQSLLSLYGSTDLMLLVLAHSNIAPGNLPGKFFEYLGSGKPILAIGPPDGDAASILNECNAGRIHDRDEIESLATSVLYFYSNWKSNNAYTAGDVSKFTRLNLTRQLIKLLE